MSIQTEDDMIPIDYDEVVTDTPLAWLLEIADEKVWVPKSQCAIQESINRHDNYCFMPAWLAFEKGLI